MGWAPLALGAIGAVTSAAGAIGQGESAAAEARYQSQVAAKNQIIANQHAKYALQAGETQAADVGMQERARAGEVTTGLAASGLDINSGSPANVRKSQAELGDLAQLRTMGNAQMTAYGYRTQAGSFGAQSQLESAEAPRDILGGTLTGLGTLAAAGSNLGFKWAGFANPST